MYITNELMNFFMAICLGASIGMFWDIFRSIRKSIKHSDLLVYIQDMIFSIFCGIYVIIFLYNLNNFAIRYYLILGIIFGIVIYLLCLSKTVMTVFSALLYPFKTLFKIIIQNLQHFFKST